jgi:hypothetical protein
MRKEKYDVGLEASVTVNLGNFESAKCGVSISINCDDKEDGYKEADEFIEKHLEEFIAQTKKLMK